MAFEFIVFDLDDTLYPRGSGVMEAIGDQIQAWVRKELDLSRQEATELRRRYLRQYGTTMGGLMTEHGVDVGRYLSFVHDIPVEEYLEPNPALARMLGQIPLRKVIYTNATLEHGLRVLRALRVTDQFERVIGIQEVGLRNKVSREAYERMLALLEAHPAGCIMVEDSPRNLRAAKALGMTTVLVDAREDGALGGADDHCIDFAVDTVLEVRLVVDELIGPTGVAPMTEMPHTG